MDSQQHLPTPSPIGVLLFVLFWAAHIWGSMTHSEFNLWIGTVIGVITIIKYGYEFYKFITKKNKKA